MHQNDQHDQHDQTARSSGPAGAPGAPGDGETLTSILDRLAAEGHEHEVILHVGNGEGPTGTWSGCEHTALLRDAEVLGTHRLEGASDPADMSLVDVIACPVCGDTATVVLQFGPEAEALHADALLALGQP
jgi:hypothetical protein